MGSSGAEWMKGQTQKMDFTKVTEATEQAGK